ncbi:hypothetical protein, conserved [Eimeria maxima]|uniref:Uncharacterized protein n=1 Tax=Eimeria maxima TaxID=5804 RepID=U6MD16_EIMMA|nr:hypothetical protein, conserved [Eimeria maxima]CDJ61931.1 hypothetical protein, conserved [Eimeria maxima]
MAGPRYKPFQFIWNRFSYNAFHIRRQRLYDRLYAVVAAAMIGFTVFQGANIIYIWQDAVHHNYRHYLLKEKTRKELAEMIRAAREEGILPSSPSSSSSSNSSNSSSMDVLQWGKLPTAATTPAAAAAGPTAAAAAAAATAGWRDV